MLNSSRFTYSLVALLLCVYPFGPAIQNLGLGLVFIASIASIILGQSTDRLKLPFAVSGPLLCLLAFLLSNVVSTWLNPGNHDQEKFAYFMGYFPLVLLPWLATALPELDKKGENQLLSLGALIVLFWGLLSASQSFFPWRWIGVSFVASGIGRAQGFYSHPMSLAYASLIIWPLAIRMLLSFPGRWQSWCLGLGSLLMLVYSMSRIAQVLVLAFTLWNIFALLSGRRRLQILLVLLLGSGLTAVTENPVSIRFRHLLQADRIDRSSAYPDDRIAFWHAHLLMIQDRPLLGHGIHLNLEFRKPYYERLGLGDFNKQYQAHNQYLQILADGGLIALTWFFAWIVLGWRLMRKTFLSPFLRQTVFQCLLIFLLGCLTQNAFDDSTVRTGLVILWLMIFLKVPRSQTHPSSKQTVEHTYPQSLHS